MKVQVYHQCKMHKLQKLVKINVKKYDLYIFAVFLLRMYITIVFISQFVYKICMKGNKMPQGQGVEPVSFVSNDLPCLGAESL